MNHSSDFFAVAFQNGPLKTTALLITLVSVFFLVPSGYGIIWYERYGSDSKRILINRLVTSVCWTGLEFYILVLPLEIVRYVYGPLPEYICLFQLMHKNIINVQTVLFCDAVSVTRYIFIFYLKNPADFKDEFWHTFINIWIGCFGLISQFVFVYMPGHQPLNFFLCTGQDPNGGKSDGSIVKKNYTFSILLSISIILQAAVALRFILHRMKIDSTSTYAYIDNFKKENWFDVLICVAFLSIAIIYGYLVVSIQTLDPVLINDYPNYLFVYGLHFAFPLIGCSTFSILFYAKIQHLRAVLVEEICEMFGKH